MAGTLAEKIERDVRTYPDDYGATGQWLDEFCSLKKHGSRLKEKLLQKKNEFDESGIQKEVAKLKRKARTTGTKKAREAAEKVAQRRQSRKDDLTKLKKQIKAVDAYLKTPKGESPVANFVLIFETWEYVCSEDPQDIKKILLIFWLLTDRFTATTGPGLTRFEKWSYGDDRACADPEEQFGTRHWTLDHLLSIFDQLIPMVEAAMRATVRNKNDNDPELNWYTATREERKLVIRTIHSEIISNRNMKKIAAIRNAIMKFRLAPNLGEKAQKKLERAIRTEYDRTKKTAKSEQDLPVK